MQVTQGTRNKLPEADSKKEHNKVKPQNQNNNYVYLL